MPSIQPRLDISFKGCGACSQAAPRRAPLVSTIPGKNEEPDRELWALNRGLDSTCAGKWVDDTGNRGRNWLTSPWEAVRCLWWDPGTAELQRADTASRHGSPVPQTRADWLCDVDGVVIAIMKCRR
jgi:hypothetical protein